MNRFLTYIAGVKKWVLALVTSAGAADAGKIVATDETGRLNETLMPGGAPIATSAGAADAGKIIKTGATGRVHVSMMPVGVAPDCKVAIASEALSASSLVNFWNDAGTEKMRKADAATGKPANGWVEAAVAQGVQGTAFFEGVISGKAGLAIGPLYLSDTQPGEVMSTPPTTAGHIIQQIGIAVSATEINYECQQAIVIG
ncbi:MAG: hypothetical protein WC378_04475 [Opitutaceae bacterium]|jgi:hypothetical protein